MKKNTTLSNAAETIITGAQVNTYSTEKKEDYSEKAFVIRGQSITKLGYLNSEHIAECYTQSQNTLAQQRLKEGDVLIMARGTDMRAGYVSKEIADLDCIVSANFIVIRPLGSMLKSEYLVAYLNSPDGIQLLSQETRGSALPSIPRSAICNFEIPLPSLEVQEQIATLFHARNEAYIATQNLAEQQYTTVTAQIEKLIVGENHA